MFASNHLCLPFLKAHQDQYQGRDQVTKNLYRVLLKAKRMETAIRDLAKQQEALKMMLAALEQPRATPYHVSSNQTSHQGPYYGNIGAQTIVPPHAHPGEDSRFTQMLQLFEERLDALEGFKQTGFDAVDLCLFPSIAIPPDFKLPTFDKYRGTSCPRSHLTMYYRKMTPHTHDDTLLIHFFQESLTGATVRWYLGLRRKHIPTWRSLAKGFLNQYKYNMDMGPDRLNCKTWPKEKRKPSRSMLDVGGS
ncbi:hypothetical protein CR513_44759, partial [Mucuna pruriens]